MTRPGRYPAEIREQVRSLEREVRLLDEELVPPAQ